MAYKGYASLYGPTLNALAPAQPKPQTGIVFTQASGGKIRFQTPRRWGGLQPPPLSGLYAILDSNKCVLYIGQKRFGSKRVDENHEHFNDWVREAGGRQNLLVTYYHMPSSTEAQRCDLEADLIHYYNPPVNKQHKLTKRISLLDLVSAPKRFRI